MNKYVSANSIRTHYKIFPKIFYNAFFSLSSKILVVICTIFNSLFLRKIKQIASNEELCELLRANADEEMTFHIYSVLHFCHPNGKLRFFIDLLFRKLFILTVNLNFNFTLSKFMPSKTVSRVLNARDCYLEITTKVLHRKKLSLRMNRTK